MFYTLFASRLFFRPCATPHRFGCHARETKHFRTQEPTGILGLAPSKEYPDYVDALVAAGAIEAPIFSLCRTPAANRPPGKAGEEACMTPLGPKRGRARQKRSLSVRDEVPRCLAEEGGVLAFGGHNATLSFRTAQLRYVPFVDLAHYAVQPTAARVRAVWVCPCRTKAAMHRVSR